MDNTEKKDRLKSLLNDHATPKAPRTKATPPIQDAKPKRRTRKPTVPPTGNVIYINGDGVDVGQVAGGNIHNVTYKTEKVDQRPRVTVVPGVEVISETQKRRLLDLRDKWIEKNNEVRKTKLTHAGAQTAINKKAGVTSYHLIPLDKFTTVEKYIQQQIGRLNNTATAKKKSPSWANDRKKGIQARCNQLGIQDWRKDYMRKTFGKESMTELTDDELQKLYQAVMSKK